MTLGLALMVALLGAVGSLLRWVTGTAVARATGGTFPAGTLAVNLIGSALIGAAMIWFAPDSKTRVALTAGLLGGFTTYSAFAWDTLALLERRSFATAALYLFGTVAGCLAACAGGAAITRAFR